MKLLLIIFLGIFCPIVSAQDTPGRPNATGFRAVDIYLESSATPLAAYQLEFWIANGAAKIVGIEGGAHPAFAEPPLYDPRAMQHERVVIAAFNTAPAERLPTGKTRVATIHIQMVTSDPPRYALKVKTAGAIEARKISVRATFEERKTK